MRIHFSIMLMSCLISLLVGYFIGTYTCTNKYEEVDTTKEVLKDRNPQGLVKEIVLESSTGKLFCPPVKKRRCIIVPPKLNIPRTYNSCNDIEEKYDQLKGNYDAMKKFCDPSCPEYLESVQIDLHNCKEELSNSKSYSPFYKEKGYF